MTAHVANHEYFHFHPIESFTRFFKFIIGTVIFIGVVLFPILLFVYTVVLLLLLSIKAIPS